MSMFGKTSLTALFQQSKKSELGDTSYTYSGSQAASFASLFAGQTELTEEEVFKIPAVVAGIELISGAISQLPVELYQETEDGNMEKVTNDIRLRIINSETNNLMTGNSFKRKLAKDYVLYGASYVKLDKLANTITGLHPLPTKDMVMQVYLSEGYRKNVRYWLNSYPEKQYGDDLIMAILKNTEDGVKSDGILKNNRETLMLALNEQKYSSSVLQNGALPIGALQLKNKATPAIMDNLKKSWEDLYSGSGNAGKTMILEEGMEYKPISMKPSEMQLSETKKTNVSDIARILNIPESMLNPEANKYASNEQNNLYFLQYCLSPIITAIESAFNRNLLLEDEKKKNYFFKFDTSQILRATAKERTEEAVAGLAGGIYSLNEARNKVGYNKLADNFFYWSLGSVLYNADTKVLITPNTGQVLKVNPDGAEIQASGTTGETISSQVAKNTQATPMEQAKTDLERG